MKKQVQITTEYINLGQFLKLTDHIFNGGEAKFFLMDESVLVNGEEENRRGRKLYRTAAWKMQVFYVRERKYPGSCCACRKTVSTPI